MSAVDGDPVSSFVFEALLAGLRTIRTTAGYHTDLGERVTEEDENPLAGVSPPWIILSEETEEPVPPGTDGEAAAGQYDLNTYAKIWFGLTAKGKEAMPMARKGRADIMKYMHSGIYFQAPMGGGAFQSMPLQVHYLQSTLSAGGINDGVAGGWVVFRVVHTVSRKYPAIGRPT